MAFQPVPNVYAIHQRATLHAQQIENIHYLEGTGGVALDVADIANKAHEAWIAHMLPPLSDEYILRETYVVDLTEEIAPTAQKVTTPNPNGGDVAEALPGSIALCLSLRTAFRGRSARGRQYISGLPTTYQNNNSITQLGSQAIVDGFNQYWSELTTNVVDSQLVIVSRVQNKVVLPQGITYAVNAVIVTDNHIDSQRRRLHGRGS
jgi:hypothetical protein